MRSARPGLVFVVVLLALAAIPATAFAVLGEFSEPSTSPEPVQDTNNSVAAGDFNNDGKTDLVVTSSEAGKKGLVILLGDGNGDFTTSPISPLALTGGPWEVLTGHFNGDANIDIAASSETDISGEDGKVTVLIGDGAGNFAPVAAPTSFASASREISAADLDEDGDLDLAVGELFPAKVSILLNNGSGVMSKAIGSPEEAGGAPTNVTAIATADLNGDDAVDMVAANGFSDDFRVLINNGTENGDFTTNAPVEDVATINDMAFGFFNNDDVPDLALANAEYPALTDNNIKVLFGNGSGGFSAGPLLGLPKGPSSVIAVDLNNDSSVDIAATGGGTPGFYAVFLGNGGGSFTAAGGSPKSIGSFPSDIVAAPLNTDGSIDLAVSNIFGKKLNILLNDFAPGTNSGGTSGGGSGSSSTTPVLTKPVVKKKACGKGKVRKKGKCVAKKCPKGKKLKKGRCVKKKPAARSNRS